MKTIASALKYWVFASLSIGIQAPVHAEVTLEAQVSEEFPNSVEVDLLAFDFTDMVSMQLVIGFDTAQATFVGFSGFNLPGLDGSGCFLFQPGKVAVQWLSPNLVNGQSVPDGTSILRIHFIPKVAGACSFLFDFNSPITVEFGDVDGITDYTLIDCNSVAGELTGKVFGDLDENCLLAVGEPGLPDLLVRVTSNGKNYFYRTNTEGAYRYEFRPNDDTLFLSVLPINNYWGNCTPSQMVVVADPALDQALDLPLLPLLPCEQLSIELATPGLVSCSNSVYTVSWCNRGTLPVSGVEAVLEFDPFLEVLSSSLPWSVQMGNTFTFPLGDLAVGDCGTFEVLVNLNCDAVLGQTHCTQATIFPVEYCDPSPLWDGAQLSLSGECAGSEVLFEIRNIGSGTMSGSSVYTAIENDIIRETGPVDPLAPDEFVELQFPANGSTWRVEVEQVPNFPAESRPNATVEGCGGFSPGFVSIFSQDEGAPYVAVDCQENVAFFNSNDKSAFPLGYRFPHLITTDTRLEYMLRFQNTGTDTAFSVVLRDTLSGLLDPASFRFQGASQPCEVQIFEDHILVCTFSGILPPASQGYLRFSIDQVAGNPLGEVISNRAAIYFDSNAPLITNEVFHTLSVDFIEDVSALFLLPLPSKRLLGSPNPTDGLLRVQLEGKADVEGRLLVYDQSGRLAVDLVWNGTEMIIPKDQLPRGILWLFLFTDGNMLGAGKVLVD